MRYLRIFTVLAAAAIVSSCTTFHSLSDNLLSIADKDLAEAERLARLTGDDDARQCFAALHTCIKNKPERGMALGVFSIIQRKRNLERWVSACARTVRRPCSTVASDGREVLKKMLSIWALP
jgi:hypothetical protein